MRYTLDNKIINIPDKEIVTSMKMLGLTKDEAIQMYLDDNGYTENEEQILLDNSASEVKINHEARVKKERKQSKPRVYVNSDEKIIIYNQIKDLLSTIAKETGGTIEVLKNEKLLQITFPHNNRPIKIDIIQSRAPKG